MEDDRNYAEDRHYDGDRYERRDRDRYDRYDKRDSYPGQPALEANASFKPELTVLVHRRASGRAFT